MERFEEKIIDLVDVVSGPEPGQAVEKTSTKSFRDKVLDHAEVKHSDLESLLQKEAGKISAMGFSERLQSLEEMKPGLPEPFIPKEVEKAPPKIESPGPKSPQDALPNNLESLIRNEVERVIRSAIGENLPKMLHEVLTREVEKVMAGENIQKMTRETLTQEIEKAIAKEIEFLKNPK